MVASKAEVNRAGDQLREWSVGRLPGALPPGAALATLLDFREGHVDPMLDVTRALNQLLESDQSTTRYLSNRLKRTPQIIQKLVRFPKTNLARMEDVAGCRVVTLGGQARADELAAMVNDSFLVVRTRDYVREPQASGYRAIHQVVSLHDVRVEIQIRTLGQQEWAAAVERSAGRVGTDVKSGDGPKELLDLLAAAGALVAGHEKGEPPSPLDLEELMRLRSSAMPLLGRLEDSA